MAGDRQQQAEMLARVIKAAERADLVWFDHYFNECAEAARAGASALAREQEMVEALKAITAHMDRAGGDADGMPECPWCKAGPDGDDHSSGCELARAREVLAKAEIPHD